VDVMLAVEHGASCCKSNLTAQMQFMLCTFSHKLF